MFKFALPAIVCAIMCLPASVAAHHDDCGCGCEPAPAPCVKTRKRLKLVEVQKEVCRLKRVCSTDAFGCPTSKMVQVKETVCRKKLALVDTPVDPCRGGRLARLGSRLRSVGSRGCCETEPSCGCEAPAAEPCGCGAAAPTMAAPMMEYSAPATEAMPMEVAPTDAEPAVQVESVLGN